MPNSDLQDQVRAAGSELAHDFIAGLKGIVPPPEIVALVSRATLQLAAAPLANVPAEVKAEAVAKARAVLANVAMGVEIEAATAADALVQKAIARGTDILMSYLLKAAMAAVVL